MPLITRVATVSMISVHEEDDGLFYDIPNVIPGKFWIPPITAAEKVIAERCNTAVRTAGSTSAERIRYAHLQTLREESKSSPYILLTIPEATTFRYGTEKQSLDEYGQKMFPDIERAPLYVKPEQVANDIERQFGQMGVIAIPGPDVLPRDIKRARELYKAWMIRRINETNKTYAQHGFAEVTKQTLNIVNRLYRDHLIPALPPWASINPDIGMAAGQSSCEVCHGILQPSDVKCPKCGAIYNWKRAVEFGLVTEANVPKSKRREAGLEGPADDTPRPTLTSAPVVGTLPDGAVVAIVEKGAATRIISGGDVPLDVTEQAFGGEQIRGHHDPEQVVESIANMDDGEAVGAGRGTGKAAGSGKRGGR